MRVEVVSTIESRLPEGDDHPYRSGPWQPNRQEVNAFDLPVTGELPVDLSGLFVRNTENPVFEAIGRYHPFDGDGMLHALQLADGKASYRSRFVRTDGLLAELAAEQPLWAGLMEPPERSLRDGWGARTRLKDASSTDVVVHGGKVLTSHYQCGDIYQFDPNNLSQLGKAPWVAETTTGWGVSAHTKVDESTGELLFFNYSKQAPYMHYGVVDVKGTLVHYVPVELPGPRLPHDMAFSKNYAILNDFPLFWDPAALAAGAHAVRYHRDMPSRFAVLPRRGAPGDVRWFEAEPTFVLHFINAFEQGDELILDGFHQANPSPRMQIDPSDRRSLYQMLDMHLLGARPYRWRFNLVTGKVSEGPLHDGVMEFGMINQGFAGRPYRYCWNMLSKPGWFLFEGIACLDTVTGNTQEYRFPDGVFASESPMAPRQGSCAGPDNDHDGYVLSYITDMNNNCSSVWVFVANDLASGPVATIALPHRICVGTHSCWAGSDQLQGGI